MLDFAACCSCLSGSHKDGEEVKKEVEEEKKEGEDAKKEGQEAKKEGDDEKKEQGCGCGPRIPKE